MSVPSVTIPVVFAADTTYLPFTTVAIVSMLSNRKFGTFYDLYILIPDCIDVAVKQKFEQSLQEYADFSLHYINMKDQFATAQISLPHVASISTYYRLAIPEILPQYDKCIYLDGDVIIVEDLFPLFSVDMDGYYCAGVTAAMAYLDIHKSYYEDMGISDVTKYINAGVLLLNLQKIRHDSLSVVLYKESLNQYKCQDQDVLNKVFYPSIRILPLKYNLLIKYDFVFERTILTPVYAIQEQDEALINPIIIHYADYRKPWKDIDLLFAQGWWYYARKTAFAEIFVQEFAAGSNSQVKAWISSMPNEKMDILPIKLFLINELKNRLFSQIESLTILNQKYCEEVQILKCKTESLRENIDHIVSHPELLSNDAKRMQHSILSDSIKIFYDRHYIRLSFLLFCIFSLFCVGKRRQYYRKKAGKLARKLRQLKTLIK